MDIIKGLLGDNLPENLTSLFPGGLPDIGQLQEIVGGMSQDELAASAKRSLADVDTARLADFGSMLSTFAGEQGLTVPEGVSTGNSADIADMLAGMVKSPGGLDGAMHAIQDASGGGGMLDSVLNTVTGGRFELVGLLRNPQVAAVLGPVVAGLMKGR